MKCPHCDVPLERGVALVPDDFVKKIKRCFFSPFSFGETVDVDKCPECGHTELLKK